MSGLVSTWLYFGCGHGSGHYLFDVRGRSPGGAREFDRLRALDGKLAPQPEREDQLYLAAFSRLEGWGCCALSWWDRSVDKRPASNSILFAPGARLPDTMLAEAQAQFPWVFSRLPQPVKLLEWSRP